MDVFNEQLLNFWRKLNDNKVRYIMIGGFATIFHGFSRITDDINLWLEDTLANRKSLRKAFIDLGYGDYESIETMDFVARWTSFYASGIELDIITEMKGLENVSFEKCLQTASVADIEGLEIPFLNINQLIENKKAINRPKDQIDVEELEKIKKMRAEK